MERWKDIPHFIKYSVSDLGRIRNVDTGRDIRLSINQRGITYVGLMKDGQQYKRSVALLVASAFLDIPIHESFDSVIHLDGDRQNCAANNLMWRPHHFVVNYMRQFTMSPPIYEGVLHCPETGELFSNSRDMAVKYGLLLRDIHAAIVNGHMIYPTRLTINPA